ncbi:EAL domain-containing protein [Williamsia sp. 1135]|uniref:sensor domain-containing phosphodiesterase n=1 Tax=Williamsia sp. 1135 TaxID=1889262 RepID=UPI000A0FDD2A|nr:EAL domain-containing protein [Williamsia sp. 1135]ORM38191.1 hypothetical protein BFL43_00835 [Williamsia sp. 1135]
MSASGDNVDVLVAGHAIPPITSVYQPIVDLSDLRTIGYEALARWPDAPHLQPEDVFSAARAAGALDELDRAAQRAALQGAHEAALPGSYALFVNVEADTTPAVSLTQQIAPARHQWAGRLVVEITERALLVDPARVIGIAESARAEGIGVALDDVGSTADCLNMLDFVAPDIIKIDGPLIRARRPTSSDAATIAAIAAYTETNPGTLIVAEGIETAADLLQARSLGAQYGQGWYLGRPGQLPTDLPAVHRPLPPFAARTTAGGHDSPSAILEHLPARVGHKGLLAALSRHLEDSAAGAHGPVTVLATFQHARNFTGAVAERFSALASVHPHAFVVALGVDMPPHPAPGVHGTAITPGEPLAQEWTITVTAPHYFGALIAHDVGDPATEPDRRFAYTFTHDRPLVTAAARTLMRRIHRT